jgi:hypothetical protein
MNTFYFHGRTLPAACALLLGGSAIAATPADKHLYLDVHDVGSVTAAQVADAHRKDLAVQGSHGVRFINYWVDSSSGDIFCLSEAPGADAVQATHREAHGLLSDEIEKVAEGK